MSSYTYAETFTRTHARRLAGRVTSDLLQCHRLYGSPGESRLEEYREELEELLAGGYVSEYHFGFKRNDQTVWSLRYVVGPDGGLSEVGRAGGVPAGINISDATYFNFLTYSSKWDQLPVATKTNIKGQLPIVRTTGSLPGTSNGYWVQDRSYAAGGVSIGRSVFRAAS
jgi:hypothetical protein